MREIQSEGAQETNGEDQAARQTRWERLGMSEQDFIDFAEWRVANSTRLHDAEFKIREAHDLLELLQQADDPDGETLSNGACVAIDTILPLMKTSLDNLEKYGIEQSERDLENWVTGPRNGTAEESEDEGPYCNLIRQLHWVQFPGMPKCADDLTFTSRDDDGRINWWDVTPPKTNYWEVHRQYGRAMALELLDLIHNPEREQDEDGMAFNWFSQIAGEIARTETACRLKYSTDGVYIGFFEAIGEHLTNGIYNR